MAVTNAQTIDPEVLDVLKGVEIQNNLVRITQSLDHPLYVKTNEVLTRLGGEWKSGRVKAHVFPEDKDPKLLLEQVIETGEMPAKNPLAFFPTPVAIVQKMLDKAATLSDVFPFCRILEPSAGDGAIVRVVHNITADLWAIAGDTVEYELTAVELDPDRAKKIRSLGRFTRMSLPFRWPN